MDIIEEIGKAGEQEIPAILDSVLLRYTQLYPQWSVSIVTIEKCEDRNEQINRMITFLKKMKKLQE